MIKHLAIAATKNTVCEDWGGTSEFTDEAITQLANTAEGKPVSIDFNEESQVGHIVSAQNKNGELVVLFNVSAKYIIVESQRLVPSFMVHKDEWINENRIIRNVESISYGLTCNPTEKDLPKIKKYI